MSFLSHDWTLVLAYTTVCAAWWGLARVVPLWRAPERPVFARPWVEIGWATVAVAGVLALGQLWSRGIRLEAVGAWRPLAEGLNQALIFAPILLLPLLRRSGWASLWIQRERLWARFATGLALAALALLVFSLCERGAPSIGASLAAVLRPAQAHLALQVLLEDLAIATLFVRLAAALRPRVAVALVAALFALGHVPAMLAQGASGAELLGLVRDCGLGVLVIGTAWRGADVAWLWPVHYVLDMTQYLATP